MHRRNIVLIVLDSVRKDIFDKASSRIKQFDYISFENCRASSSWTAPSHASMISGELTHSHNVHTHSRSFSSLLVERTFLDYLESYTKVGISANSFAGPSYEFDQYFDRFFELKREFRFPRAINPSDFDWDNKTLFEYIIKSIKNDRSLKSMLNFTLGFLGSNTDILNRIFDQGAKPGLRVAREEITASSDPTFIFLNLMEGHIPHHPSLYLDSDLYDCPYQWDSNGKNVWDLIFSEYDEQYWHWRNQLYRATIDYLDQQISRFIHSLDDQTTVIITSDHGENLATGTDNNLANHKSSLTEGLLHVPMYIINPPDAEIQTKRYFSHLNFPMLIRAVRDGHIPDLTSQRIFAEQCGMSPGPNPKEEYQYYNRAIRCAYDQEKKIVWDSLGNCDKYTVNQNEANWQRQTDELVTPPNWATNRFQTGIREFKNKTSKLQETVSIDQSTKDRLQSLGYK